MNRDIIRHMISKMTGKRPEDITFEEGNMSINRFGELEEHLKINVGQESRELIIQNIDENTMKRRMKKIMEEEERLVEENYKRMNLIDDFENFPGVRDFQVDVFEWINDINADDFLWLCEELGKFENILNDNKLTNVRICRTTLDELTERYRTAKNNGCCKVYDNIVTNPKTRNKFSIGCNHDHIQLKEFNLGDFE